jgi:hypothetical protein
MVAIGYTIMGEQAGPKQLVADARRAEDVGFDFIAASDHYFPWLDSQGHAPYVWSVLGAVAHATERIELMTYVTCPILRYHPAVVAQKAATVQLLADGRFTLGVGSGEHLNEHVVGDAWPAVDVRHEMLRESLEIIRQLFTGDTVTFRGDYLECVDAKLWDLPPEPPRIGVAVSGAASSELALCYDADESAAVKRAHDQFRWFSGGWSVNAELRDTTAFASASQSVREEDVAEGIPCGPDVAKHVEAVQKFVDAGYTHVAVVQIGAEHQDVFFDWAQAELLPELRKL